MAKVVVSAWNTPPTHFLLFMPLLWSSFACSREAVLLGTLSWPSSRGYTALLGALLCSVPITGSRLSFQSEDSSIFTALLHVIFLTLAPGHLKLQRVFLLGQTLLGPAFGTLLAALGDATQTFC